MSLGSSSRIGLKPSRALQAALDVISEKLADSAKVIGYEFERLNSVEEAEWDALRFSLGAQHPKANRYIDVLPFDNNRVVLSTSDYINASFLSSKANALPGWSYIATQGPLAETAPQFWQMVLEQRSAVIIMLTRTHEKKMEKCAQYFPSTLHEEATYVALKTSVMVRVTNIQDLGSDIRMRELTMMDLVTQHQHQVRHYHYHRWCSTPSYCTQTCWVHHLGFKHLSTGRSRDHDETLLL